jgi:hypothetical protein
MSSQVSWDETADRRICAGTYLDRDFRDRVLRAVYNERNRRVAPSYGFDLVPVVRHAWRAWWLETCEYLLTLAVVGAGLAVRPLDTLIALNLLALWYLLRLWRNWVLRLIGRGDPQDLAFDRMGLLWERQLLLREKALKSCLWASLVTLLVLTVASARTGGSAPWPAGTGLGVAEIVIALCAIVAGAAAARVVFLGKLRSAAPLPARLSRRMGVIDGQQHHPFTAHAGFRPFIGSGKHIRSWSFAQRLVRADHVGLGRGKEFDEPPFTAQRLVNRLKDRISALRDDDNPETRLPGLTVTDHVFVDGTRAARFGRALASAPQSGDVQIAIAEAIANPSDVARHYLGARIKSWGGDVVTSVFVHVSLQGRTLYLEFATYALFPIRPEYRVEQLGGTGARAIARSIGKGLAALPEQVLATRRVARAAVLLCSAVRPGDDRTAAASLRTDIGAVACAREEAMIEADTEFRAESESSYFQYQDITQHSKIVERQLIAAVDGYLRELGVDSSEFVQRTTAILNNGVINAGPGTVNIDQSAIGDQSSVVVQAGNAEG